jgi:hypothetical protein
MPNRSTHWRRCYKRIPPSWPFAVWALDIVGPFPCTIEGYRFLYVTINKFTKWPKATPVVKINKQSAMKFIKSIVCRTGSSPTMGPSSPAVPSKGTVKTLASKYAMCQLLIQRVMDKWSEQMQKFSKVSRLIPMMASRSMARSGLMIFRVHYGATEHHPVKPRVRHLSSWCTG